MDLSLLHAGLAAGATLAALPVILHLFMKQTPKHVIFPALRLIRERQKRSRKKLRIKNWLLLLARMALVALMALALARPSLFSQTTLGDREVPTALGLVFDTSLSMGYTDKFKTRLDEAKERADEILKKTPATSQVFVVDSAEPGVPVPLSPAAARKRIEGLALRAAQPRSLNAAVGQAYAAVADSDRPRHEVYILTDLAGSSWEKGRPVEGLDKIKEVKTGVGTYLLRLTPKEAHDIAVVEAEPSENVATQGETVEIKAILRSRGPALERVVEFYLDDVPKGKQPVALPANGETMVRFTTPKLDPSVPLHQGFVRVRGAPDPMSFDDVRYFTFKVQPAMKVLVVSDLEIDAEFVADAIDPSSALLPPGAPRTCQVERVRPEQLASRARDSLRKFTCVFLLNVTQLAEADWGRLNDYVREGGGVVIGLGDRCLPENYIGPVAAQLVPAAPSKVQDPKAETVFGRVSDFNHPLFNRYSKQLDAVLSQVPIYHYWSVTPPEGSRTLLTYSDGAPALVERVFQGVKTGRALLWTTPLARRVDRKSPAAWNEFPQYWPFLAIQLQTVPYLAGISAERLNFEAGQDVVLAIDPTRRFKNYVVQGPDAKTTDRLTPEATSDALVIVTPQPVGQWKVTASGPEGAAATLGFSVNPPLAETQLVPLEPRDLDALFGKNNYHLADDPESLNRAITRGRVGHEIFPWLMALILVVVTAENFLANRFYCEGGARSATVAA